MPTEENDDQTPQRVLVNEEEQYSLWPKDNPVPNGLLSQKSLRLFHLAPQFLLTPKLEQRLHDNSRIH